MHIKKNTHDCSRRAFLDKVSKGTVGAGVLAPLWPLISEAKDITEALPEELLSIESYTKGKIKVGDMLTADNVIHVKDLLDPITYIEVAEQGRQIKIVETTTDATKLYPAEYLEATIKNQGKAKLDENNNVVTQDGQPWIGGNPFPDAQTGLEAYANLTLSWGRHDSAMYAIRDWDIGPDGSEQYQYDFVWSEQNTVGLVNSENPYMEGREHLLRYNAIWFTYPNDSRGTSFVNTWYYDQRKFPDLYGYIPAFKRVRRFPSSQRFEPLVPGITLFLSDGWCAGDPMLTWGNYKIVGRQPMLGGVSQNWHGSNPNSEPSVHGGPQGKTFFETTMEMIPEVLVIDLEPTGFPRAPVGKKRVWLDTRTMMFVACVTYDRRGELWKSVQVTTSQFIDGDTVKMDGDHPGWSWTKCHVHDIQTDRMSRFYHADEIRGGFKSGWNQEGLYEKYMTIPAIRRLGS